MATFRTSKHLIDYPDFLQIPGASRDGTATLGYQCQLALVIVWLREGNACSRAHLMSVRQRNGVLCQSQMLT